MRRCSIFVLYSLEVGMDMLPLVALIGGSTTSLSATGARRFVVFFSADDDRQFLPCAPWSLSANSHGAVVGWPLGSGIKADSKKGAKE